MAALGNRVVVVTGAGRSLGSEHARLAGAEGARVIVNDLGARPRRCRVRFKEQVWAGDALTCSGQVDRTHEVDGVPHADLDLARTRQTGGVAIRGLATSPLPS